MEREKVEALARAGLRNLEAHRQRIDDLNVYPVPDGDTGTNLVLTLAGIVEAIEASRAEDAPTLAAEVSDAALRAGKGNSGVIFSQIVRGAAAVLGEDHAPPSAELLARALRAGSDAAYRAVQRIGPVEGTILTVVRELAEEAEEHAHDGLAAPELLRIVLARGEDALARTRELNETLARAGVVDAGGAGLVEILRGIALAADGAPLPSPDPLEDVELGVDAIHQELSRYRYCTGFLVLGEGLDADALEEALAPLGDSLLVVGDETALKVHVHTDDPGRALGIATAVGVLDEIEIANMHVQTEARERRLLETPPAAPAEPATGLVVVTQGDGLRRLFEGEGAVVVEGGESRNPSVEDIAAAIRRSGAPDVLVLPNSSNVLLAAEQAVQMVEAPRARVVPTTSLQAGVAVLDGYVSSRPGEENERKMLEKLQAIATGEVTTATRDGRVGELDVRSGSYFGTVDGEAVAAGDDLERVLLDVVARLLEGDRSYLVVVSGAGAPAEDRLRDVIEAAHPGLELDVIAGGQPHYPLLLLAE